MQDRMSRYRCHGRTLNSDTLLSHGALKKKCKVSSGEGNETHHMLILFHLLLITNTNPRIIK